MRASWFWPPLGRYSGTWGIFSSPRDSKLNLDGLGLQWNGDSKTFFNAHLQASGPKCSPLYFNTEKLAETTLRASWFSQTSGGFPGTWGIFSSLLDAKLGADGLVFQWNGHSKDFWTLTFELVGRNMAILHFKTERVAETTFRASWFWSTSARFLGTCEIFFSLGDS